MEYTATIKEARHFISVDVAKIAKALLLRIFNTLTLKMMYLLTQDFHSNGVKNVSDGVRN